MPFPNFPVLAPNLQLFHQNNVTMVFEQGFTTKNTEMNDLRCYVLSKLLWNPNYSTDSLVDKFLTAYYGAAAPYIREYISLTEIELKKSAKGLSIYQPPFTNSTSFLRPDLMKRYFEILEKGKNAVKNDSLYALHVENVIQQVRYAWLEVSRDNVHSTNWLFEENENGFFVPKPENIGMLSALCNHARIYGPDQFDERRLSPDIYESKMNDYFQHGVSVNFKKIKNIKLIIPNSSKYPADGPKTLVDGVKGVMNYNSLWLGWENSDMEAVLEMKTTTEIKKVTMNFMYFSESWILLPKKVRVSFSMDGVHFQDTVVWLDTTAAQKMEKQIFTCSLSLAKAVKANFVKVYVEKLGLMPAWTEVKGDAWFFIDEIDIE